MECANKPLTANRWKQGAIIGTHEESCFQYLIINPKTNLIYSEVDNTAYNNTTREMFAGTDVTPPSNSGWHVCSEGS